LRLRGRRPWLGNGVHADLALHGEDGRDASLGEEGPEGGQCAEGIAAVPAAGAFAGGEHDQAGPEVGRQSGNTLGEGLTRDDVSGAVVFFEPEVGPRRVGVAKKGAVADEVEDIVALAQPVDEAVGGDPHFLDRIAGERCEGHVAQCLAGTLQFALHVDGGEGLAAARRGITFQVRGVGDGDQGPELALGAKFYLLPTGAGQEAGEEEVLFDDQPGVVLGVAKGFPAEPVQVGGTAIDQQAEAQGALGGPRPGLVEEAACFGALEEACSEEAAIGSGIVFLGTQLVGVERDGGPQGSAYLLIAGVVEAQLECEAFALATRESDFQIGICGHESFSLCCW
jgi:hypothetical protein